MKTNEIRTRSLAKIRLLVAALIVGLVISGATAIPLESEITMLAQMQHQLGIAPESGLSTWINRIQTALSEANAKYPFLAYGTDWLAFAHFVIAVAFIGPLRDPVKNVWVIQFGMIACALVVPFALCMGAVRGIPIWWRLIDWSFGAIGVIPLWLCYREIKRISGAANNRE